MKIPDGLILSEFMDEEELKYFVEAINAKIRESMVELILEKSTGDSSA